MGHSDVSGYQWRILQRQDNANFEFGFPAPSQREDEPAPWLVFGATIRTVASAARGRVL